MIETTRRRIISRIRYFFLNKQRVYVDQCMQSCGCNQLPVSLIAKLQPTNKLRDCQPAFVWSIFSIASCISTSEDEESDHGSWARSLSLGELELRVRGKSRVRHLWDGHLNIIMYRQCGHKSLSLVYQTTTWLTSKAPFQLLHALPSTLR